jgi:ATP-binding cassette subfamily F protein 3
VLDEPTNHLDAATRDALTDALADFAGALLLVSHDRYLLRSSVDRFLLVHDGRADEFDGDLDDYLAWLQKGAAAERAGASAAAALADPDSGPRVDRKEERRLAAQRRQQMHEQLRPLERQLSAAEQRLQAIDGRLRAIEQELSDPLVYRDAQRPVTLGRERAALAQEKETLELQWLEWADQREQLQRESA